MTIDIPQLKPKSLTTQFGLLYSFILAVICALGFIALLDYFFRLADVGINVAANSIFLTFLILPVSGVVFFTISLVSFSVLSIFKAIKVRPYLVYFFTFLIVGLSLFLAYDFNLWTLRNYPLVTTSSVFWKYILGF